MRNVKHFQFLHAEMHFEFTGSHKRNRPIPSQADSIRGAYDAL
jgi:hypothetical protein